MSFLQLSNIGKIYVSEGNVAVGIRGVNLNFELGEFVAITGASGSGKSTLLNVLSGMDTYEEGELYIEGQPTSHYLQPDWEEYRAKYISFIFQDYNIIDSFTVLQNVELALMTISDPLERRRRAIELIDRVGLSSHMKHKGSQLSGGQKQRTVIARALAKDSPIILADEPTGNLDSETSKEIIKLLREVSKEKLLIMVTHNFDQVADVATRHIRVFDGAVESDQTISATEYYSPEGIYQEPEKKISVLSNGLLLGRSIFFSKPKLSSFLCLLLLIGSVGIFFATGIFGQFRILFQPNYMFNYQEGRLILIHSDGTPLSSDELEKIVNTYDGAERYLRCDKMIDKKSSFSVYVDTEHDFQYYCDISKDIGTPDEGSYPKTEKEVFLHLPIYAKGHFFVGASFNISDVYYIISGIKYYLDNTKYATAYLTNDGLNRVNVSSFRKTEMSVREIVLGNQAVSSNLLGDINVRLDDTVPDGKLCISGNTEYIEKVKNSGNFSVTIGLKDNAREDDYDDFFYRAEFVEVQADEKIVAQVVFPKDAIVFRLNDSIEYTNIYVNSSIQLQLQTMAIDESYKQASVYFSSNRKARNAAEELNKNGYLAVLSDTTVALGITEIIVMLLTGGWMIFMWFMAVVFLAFFVRLCSNRSVTAFREDIAILRSMGIPVKVVRLGIYIRMFLALVPSLIIVPILAAILYRLPKWNAMLVYLKPWQYVALFLAMIYLVYRVTRRQIKDLFGTSVKKSLQGGNKE